MSLSKKKKLVSSFFNSQYNYCTLIWMFHSCIKNNKTSRLHERCLHLLCRGKSSLSEKLFEQGKSVTIHSRNLQISATAISKCIKIYLPPFLKEWKPENCSCRLCQKYISDLGFITVTSRAFLAHFIYRLFLRFILFKFFS